MATAVPSKHSALSSRESPGRGRLIQNHEWQKTMPYLNYATPFMPPSTKVSVVDTKADSPRNSWTGPRGYGARHVLDDAPFSLWDEGVHDFRLPTFEEESWLVSRYKAVSIGFQLPIIVIETDTPPNPLPLTVAAVAAKFVPPPDFLVGERNVSNLTRQPLPDARPIGFTTNYAGIRGPGDPLQFRFRNWIQPTNDEIQLLLQALIKFCNPRLVHILCPRLIVELYCDDGRTYEPGSLPIKIGGFSTHYHHQPEPIFDGLSVQSRERVINPTSTVQDASNYLQVSNHPTSIVQDASNYLQVFDELCPGVRVSSGTATDVGGNAQVSMSSTAGVLLRNNRGHQRLTVSNHGFLYSSEVFHPSENGVQIGEVDERWPHLDAAMVRLNPSIRFTNSTYFEAMTPRRLLHRREIPDGAFFSVDGMSTGCVFMQFQGTTLAIPRRPPNLTAIHFSTLRIFRGFGALESSPREGSCGSPIVEENSEDGGVAGFFQEGNDEFAFSPCLDELIDRSWSVV